MKEIYNHLIYDDKLSSSGMPTTRQMKSVAEAGVQLVINLAPHDAPKALPNETELVGALGMEYINIPVDWKMPTMENLNIFMDAMDANKDMKIHVHCEANFRASGFVTLYRILRLGWSPKEALTAMHSIWNEDAYPVWKSFIERAIKTGNGDN